MDGKDRRTELLIGDLTWGLGPGESRDLKLTYWATDVATVGLREPQEIVLRSGIDGAYEDVARVVLEVVEP